MLSCNEVTRLCASEGIRRAPLARRLAVRLHLLMCRHCRRYVRELSAIGVAVREAFDRTLGTGVDSSALERRILTEAKRADGLPQGGHVSTKGPRTQA